jgi:hypothetical protein
MRTRNAQLRASPMGRPILATQMVHFGPDRSGPEQNLGRCLVCLANVHSGTTHLVRRYAISLLARPTSGQCIPNLQNEAISYNMSKKWQVLHHWHSSMPLPFNPRVLG